MAKVLIIEDEEQLLSLLKTQLEEEKFDVVTAGDGLAGLNLALKEHPDLILLDIKMPVMNGISMLEKLRADSWGNNVPVVILTNLSDSENISKGLTHNIAKYYVKADWKLEDLAKDIKDTLSKHQETYKDTSAK